MKQLYAVIMADLAVIFICLASGIYLFGYTMEQSFGMGLASACAVTVMAIVMDVLRSC